MNRTSSLNLHFCLIAAALLFVGCDAADPPAFRLNMVEAVSNEVGPEYQQEIADVLVALFGTPDQPFALPETGLDQALLNMSAGAAWSDEKGTNHGLYRKHCVHCHGITGDGRGPTARFLNPYPRDYRPGVYKFKSTFNPAKPTDEDLHRVLVNGVPGTAMPSFSLLPGSEVESLVEYVKYLSYRGQMESQLMLYVYDELGEIEEEDEEGNVILEEDGNPKMVRIRFDPVNNPDQRDAVSEMLAGIVEEWEDTNNQVIIPKEEEIPADDRSEEEVLASIEKGRKLFYEKRANCYTCHGPTGLGDGQQTDYDNWNKVHKAFLDGIVQQKESIEKRVSKGGLKDEDLERLHEDRSRVQEMQVVADTLYKPRNAIPRNLRQGIYRGGRRRIDIFHRIYAGIAGSPMPASGPASAGAEGALTEEEMWNIVDYVLSLPYEPASQPQKALPINPGSAGTNTEI